MLALDLDPPNITVNAIAPGRFESNMTTSIVADHERYQHESTMVPLDC